MAGDSVVEPPWLLAARRRPGRRCGAAAAGWAGQERADVDQLSRPGEGRHAPRQEGVAPRDVDERGGVVAERGAADDEGWAEEHRLAGGQRLGGTGDGEVHPLPRLDVGDGGGQRGRGGDRGDQGTVRQLEQRPLAVEVNRDRERAGLAGAKGERDRKSTRL